MAEVKQEAKPLSRSEREALIKDKAGWVIVVMAALLAINTYMGGSNSSKATCACIQSTYILCCKSYLYSIFFFSAITTS